MTKSLGLCSSQTQTATKNERSVEEDLKISTPKGQLSRRPLAFSICMNKLYDWGLTSYGPQAGAFYSSASLWAGKRCALGQCGRIIISPAKPTTTRRPMKIAPYIQDVWHARRISMSHRAYAILLRIRTMISESGIGGRNSLWLRVLQSPDKSGLAARTAFIGPKLAIYRGPRIRALSPGWRRLPTSLRRM